MITLSERLQLELRNRDPSEVTELILDNSKANEIEGLNDSFVNLRELSLVNVGLITLKGFPLLPNLKKLDLSDNKLSFGLDNLIRCPQLVQLLLTNNRIKIFKEIESLAMLKNLEILDLFNCAISSEENYRNDIFALIPSLKYLDGFDEKNEEELNESEEYEEEEENEAQSENKDVYELSEDSGSDEEYESEDEAEIVNIDHTSGKACNTLGKDMNLYSDDVAEITDEEDDEEEYEVESYDDNNYDQIIEINGKSKTANYVLDDCNEILSANDDSSQLINTDNNSNISVIDNLSNGIKRTYDSAFNDYNFDDYDDEDDSTDSKINRKQLKHYSDFELTDDSSSLLDKL